MPKQYDIKEVYPNSPLVEVVCEIRFPEELSIVCRTNDFYDKIRDNYPNILVPQKGGLLAGALPTYRFENQDQNSGIMLAINRFSYYEKEYSGHKPFIKEFIRLTKIFGEMFTLKHVNRLGWRYINAIPFTREDGIVPLQQFINFDLNLPGEVSRKYENFSFTFISRVTNGTITTKIESVARSDEQQEAILLDFDFANVKKLTFSNIKDKVNEAHNQARNLFENYITDEYRQYLKGETI
ncbi:MAG: TIGR04255 family protein [Candidatus Scalindua sp. AMX11]|nr:MAG: TIGR04255 family protein [Candidatus Scalindua sp.]NOG85237.1 TIGR04255 family protein [Planctomycetota bacterium]RZV61713.1 MAG: TIGR04255 family protein [Candidatus Scalindua sp. SCAELEC01]TDE63250.1 MAG: TIGR04255 family protein [Candidatus Scalindua sp. AMX11]